MKGSQERCLFIRTRQNRQIFGVILFVKLKTKNKKTRLCFCFVFVFESQRENDSATTQFLGAEMWTL